MKTKPRISGIVQPTRWPSASATARPRAHGAIIARPRPKPREEADAYPHIVRTISEDRRVIESACDLQWIIQDRRGSRDGEPTWRSRWFCMTRIGIARFLGDEIAADFPETYVRRSRR